jgi:hypothetical protein
VRVSLFSPAQNLAGAYVKVHLLTKFDLTKPYNKVLVLHPILLLLSTSDFRAHDWNRSANPKPKTTIKRFRKMTMAVKSFAILLASNMQCSLRLSSSRIAELANHNESGKLFPFLFLMT